MIFTVNFSFLFSKDYIHLAKSPLDQQIRHNSCYSPFGGAYRVKGITGLAQMGFKTRRRKLNIQMIDEDDVSASLPVESEIRKKLLKINDGSSTATRVQDVLQDQRMMLMTTYPIGANLYEAGLPRKVRVKFFFLHPHFSHKK